jgi:hypothetical protein
MEYIPDTHLLGLGVLLPRNGPIIALASHLYDGLDGQGSTKELAALVGGRGTVNVTAPSAPRATKHR